MGKLHIHGREIPYEDGDYAMLSGYHSTKGKLQYTPFDVHKFEVMSQHNLKQGTMHILRVKYTTIEFALERPEEYNFSEEQKKTLEKSCRLFKAIYRTLDTIISTKGTD